MPTTDWKGQLQTFCRHYSCSIPKYASEQLISAEWCSKCTVEYPNTLLSKQNDHTTQSVTTTSTNRKKKESQADAARQMLSKLKSLLSPHILLDIKHQKHIKKLVNLSSFFPMNTSIYF